MSKEPDDGILVGTWTYRDVGWQLNLKGSTTYGNPCTVRSQGTGVVGGEEWVYDYIGYVVRPWPNGVNQRMAMSAPSSAPSRTRAVRAASRPPASSAPGSQLDRTTPPTDVS